MGQLAARESIGTPPNCVGNRADQEADTTRPGGRNLENPSGTWNVHENTAY